MTELIVYGVCALASALTLAGTAAVVAVVSILDRDDAAEGWDS